MSATKRASTKSSRFLLCDHRGPLMIQSWIVPRSRQFFLTQSQLADAQWMFSFAPGIAISVASCFTFAHSPLLGTLCLSSAWFARQPVWRKCVFWVLSKGFQDANGRLVSIRLHIRLCTSSFLSSELWPGVWSTFLGAEAVSYLTYIRTQNDRSGYIFGKGSWMPLPPIKWQSERATKTAQNLFADFHIRDWVTWRPLCH